MFKQTEVGAGRESSPAGRRSRAAPPEHDVVTVLGGGVEAVDFLGRILEVAVHHDDPSPAGRREAGGDRGVLAEVAGKANCAHAGIVVAQRSEDRPGVVGPAVVDEDQLVVVGDVLQACGQPSVQLDETAGAAVDRHDDAQLDVRLWASQ